jgi:hypothetical protein
MELVFTKEKPAGDMLSIEANLVDKFPVDCLKNHKWYYY